jgi:phosphatidyl-myo-inositol dimannoside synthase
VADALLVTSSFLPGHGGIERYLAELCGVVAPRLAVLAPGQRDGLGLPPDLGYDAIAGPGSMLRPGRKVRDAIVRNAADLGTDRVVFGTPWPLVLLGPQLRKRGLRYSVIVHAAEMLVPAAIPGVSARLTRALSEADLLLPVSDFTADKIEELLTRKKRALPPIERLGARVDIDRFTPSVDVHDLRRRLELNDAEKVIVYFGRLVKRKGVHRLVDALDEIAGRSPSPVVFLIGGTGPEEARLKRMASRCKSRVVFAGRVDDADAPAFYALGDAFVLPVVDRYSGLETEGLGIVLLEASSCGVPSVTGRSGGTVEAVIDGRTGFHIDARDRTALVEKTSFLLTDAGAAGRMGAAARSFVEQKWSNRIPPEPLLRWLG